MLGSLLVLDPARQGRLPSTDRLPAPRQLGRAARARSTDRQPLGIVERLRNQSLRNWVRVSSVTTFRVITKQGGDEIHHHMCTQGRYLRSPTSLVLAVHFRHSIKRKHATTQHLISFQRRPLITISYRRDHHDIYSHPPRAHTTKTSKPVTDYTSCIDQR